MVNSSTRNRIRGGDLAFITKGEVTPLGNLRRGAIIFECCWCQDPFGGYKGYNRIPPPAFCSSECEESFKRLNDPQLKMRTCGRCDMRFATYESTNLGFCARPCRGYIYALRGPCQRCGSNFHALSSRPYCSAECSVLAGLVRGESPPLIQLKEFLLELKKPELLFACQEIAQAEEVIGMVTRSLWKQANDEKELANGNCE